VETWVLLPAFGTDWRWGRGQAPSPWHPHVRQLRQASAGEWGPVLDEVERALASR